MNRDKALQQIRDRERPWDLAVIGGGATGVAIALDAVTRGLDVLLAERFDFGKGTSSRSTKLIHGGVRYLEQGNLTLVRDALRERSLLRSVAPMLVHDLPFFIPCESRVQKIYFRAGLKLYDLLAGRSGFEKSRGVSGAEVARLFPTLAAKVGGGGVIYHDGQFDDARLLIHMLRTFDEAGGCAANYLEVTGLEKNAAGTIGAVQLTDHESGETLSTAVKCVVNAAGPFSDDITLMDNPQRKAALAASQGVHIVLPKKFFPGDTALIVPRTSDGRVLFLIPWYDRVVVGTTDTPIAEPVIEPRARAAEIDFLLETVARYIDPPPQRSDITSVFVGIRPLVKDDRSSRTASLSRDHEIVVSSSGLVTIRGGKWTTVRKMAEDCVDRAIDAAALTAGPCRTDSLRIYPHAADDAASDPSPAGQFRSLDEPLKQQLIEENPELARPLAAAADIRAVDIVWAVRQEMARTVEDVLARRLRLLFLDVSQAIAAAPETASLMARELGRDEAWQQRQLAGFRETAGNYDIAEVVNPD